MSLSPSKPQCPDRPFNGRKEASELMSRLGFSLVCSEPAFSGDRQWTRNEYACGNLEAQVLEYVDRTLVRVRDLTINAISVDFVVDENPERTAVFEAAARVIINAARK